MCNYHFKCYNGRNKYWNSGNLKLCLNATCRIWEGDETVFDYTAQNWFRLFKGGWLVCWNKTHDNVLKKKKIEKKILPPVFDRIHKSSKSYVEWKYMDNISLKFFFLLWKNVLH